MRPLAIALIAATAALAQDAPPAPAPKPAENPVAVIQTSMGEIRVRLYADEAPKTVANFLELAEGTKEFKDAGSGEMVRRPYYDGLVFHRVIKDFMVQTGCPRGDGTGDPGYRFADEINAKSLGLDKVKVLVDGQPGHPCLQVRTQEEFHLNVILPILRGMGIDSQEKLDARMDEVNRKLQETIPNMTVMEALQNLGYTYEETHASHEPKRGSLAMANGGPGTNGSQFFINLADTPWLTGRHTVFGEVVKGMEVVEAIGAVETGEADRPVTDVKILSIRRLAPEAAEPAPAPEPAGG